MEEDNDIEKTIFENIEKTYIVKLVGGRQTSKGSFWAVDESEKEYYITSRLVKENEQIILGLEFNLIRYWSLVQGVNWRGGNWNGKQVSFIMMMAFEKSNCELFKEGLREYWEFNFSSRRKIDDAIGLISKGTDRKISDQLVLESEQLRIIAQTKEEDLTSICRGWEDIDR